MVDSMKPAKSETTDATKMIQNEQTVGRGNMDVERVDNRSNIDAERVDRGSKRDEAVENEVEEVGATGCGKRKRRRCGRRRDVGVCPWAGSAA